MEQISTQKTGRTYKDTLFRALFGDSRNFLELYNAVANEDYPEDTIVTPCPTNDLLAKFNDLAACIELDVLTAFLTEHYLEVSKMLNWEYDSEAEKRVLTEEAKQQGMQQGMQRGMMQGAELVATLLKEGFSLEDALEKVKSASSDVLPS